MPSPELRRGSMTYYVAFGLLLAVIAVAASLLARAVHQTSVQAEIAVSPAQPVDCPTGEHAPACYRFEVTNLGPEAARADCRLASTSGSYAEFMQGGNIRSPDRLLLAGESLTLVAKVLPGIDSTVHPPTLSCDLG